MESKSIIVWVSGVNPTHPKNDPQRKYLSRAAIDRDGGIEYRLFRDGKLLFRQAPITGKL